MASIAALSPLFGSHASLILHDYFDMTMALLVNLLAIICGVFILHGRNWARWVMILWMVFHVIISLESPIKLTIHVVIFSTIIFFLFRPATSGYFHSNKPKPV